MEANAVADLLFKKYGKKWHFITPDYAFGHTLYDACTDDARLTMTNAIAAISTWRKDS